MKNFWTKFKNFFVKVWQIYTLHPLLTIVITGVLIACIYLPIQEVYYEEWFGPVTTETIDSVDDANYQIDSLQIDTVHISTNK